MAKTTKRKSGNIITGIAMLVALCVAFTGVYIVGKTIGQKTVMAAGYQDEVGSQVSEDTASALTEGIVNTLLDTTLVSALSTDSISQILTDTMSDMVTDVDNEAMSEAIHKAVFTTIGTTSGALSSSNLEQVRDVANKIVVEKLSTIDVASLDENQIAALREAIKQDIINDPAFVASLIPTIDLPDQIKVEDVISQLDFSQIVREYVKLPEMSTEVTTQKYNEIAASLTEMVTTLINKGANGSNGSNGTNGTNGSNGTGTSGADGKDGKDGYIPIKGVDYFTEAEIEAIKSAAAAAVESSVDKDLNKLLEEYKAVQTQINALSTQVAETDKEVQTLLEKEPTVIVNGDMQGVIDLINKLSLSVDKLNISTADLTKKVDIENTNLKLFSNNGGLIFKAETMDTKDMTISNVLNVLSANDKTYTTAINQMWYIMQQVEQRLGGNFEELDSAIADLSGKYDTSLRDVVNIYDEMAALRAKDIQKYTELQKELQNRQDSLQSAINVLANAIASGDPDAIESARSELINQLNTYLSYVTENKDYITSVGGNVTSMLEYINNMLEAAQNPNISLDDLMATIRGNSGSLSQETTKVIENISEEIKDLKNEIEDLKKHILSSASKEKVTELESQIKLYERLDTLIKEIPTDINLLLSRLQEAIASGDEEAIASIRESLSVRIQEYISYLTSNYDKFDAETKAAIDTLLAKLNAMKDIVDDPSKSASDVVTQLTAQVTQLQPIISSVTTVIENKIVDLNKDLSDLQNSILQSTETISVIEETVRKEINDRIQSDSVFSAAIQDLKDKIDADREALENAIESGNQEDIDALTEQLNATIDELTALVDSNTETLSSLIDTNVDNIYAHIEEVQTALDKQSTDGLKTVTDNLSELSQSMSSITDTLGADVSSLNFRLDALDSNLDARILDLMHSDTTFSDMLTESLTECNESIANLRSAILDDDEGAIAEARRELLEKYTSLGEQLIENRDALQENLDIAVDDLLGNIKSQNDSILLSMKEQGESLSQDLIDASNALTNSISNVDANWKLVYQQNKAQANTRCYNVTLKHAAGTSVYSPESSTVYHTGDASSGYSWVIDGEQTGLVIKGDDSDIQVSYSSETQANAALWGLYLTYSIVNNNLVITVPSEYASTLGGDLVIDVIHVSNADLDLTEVLTSE